MDVSGCQAPFTEAEIKRFLDGKTYERFDRLRTDHEIRKVTTIIISANSGGTRRTSILSVLSVCGGHR